MPATRTTGLEGGFSHEADASFRRLGDGIPRAADGARLRRARRRLCGPRAERPGTGHVLCRLRLGSMFWNPATITMNPGWQSQYSASIIVPNAEIQPLPGTSPLAAFPAFS